MDRLVSLDRLLAEIANFQAKVREEMAKHGETSIETSLLALLQRMKELFDEEKRQLDKVYH
jgi:hypothetical protein